MEFYYRPCNQSVIIDKYSWGNPANAGTRKLNLYIYALDIGIKLDVQLA